MIFGYTPFTGSKFCGEGFQLPSKKFTNLEISNAIYDEVKIDQEFIDYNVAKESWGNFTVFLAKFQNNLNAGNVDFAGKNITKLRIKRKKVEEFDWQTVGQWNFDINQKEYEAYDRYVQAHQPYEYTIVPVINDDIEGDPILIKDIAPDFDDTFLMDKSNMYRFTYNLEYGSITKNIDNQIIKPLSGRYPIAISNGETNYDSGSIDLMLISDDYEHGYNSRPELIYRKQLMNFICDGKPKILKHGNGDMWVVSITGQPRLQPRNDLRQVFYDLSFEWVEIADANSLDDLIVNGLVVNSYE